MARGQIFTKPTSRKEAEDPEVLVQGFGRLKYSQLKAKVMRDDADATKALKSGRFAEYKQIIDDIGDFLEAILDIEAEMKSPRYKRMMTRLKETPTVNVGGGAIAGLGVGPQGEPGLTRAQQARYKKRNIREIASHILKRKSLNESSS